MTWVVIPAAGRGTRLGGDVPKQYLEVDGMSLIAHTLHALLSHTSVEGAMVVLAADDEQWPGWQEFAGKPLLSCIGGKERSDSVLAGLAALSDRVRPDDFVLVHDAARPNVGGADLDHLLERGRNDPVGAILATPVRDTLKRAGNDSGIDGTEPREHLWRALTPQLFRRLQLTRALEAARDGGTAITDESMAMELQGLRPLLVEGSQDNFKITTAADLARFEYVLSRR